VHTYQGAACSRSVTLSKLGAWRITLTVTDAKSRTSSRVFTPNFRDLLVVSLGDSYASGEGNPSNGWADETCHRSRNGWPAQAARNVIENYQTTVTFLSYACSGATIHNLYDQYQDAEPPQVLAARWDIGSPSGTSTRRVDALLLSGGVNDLGFHDILLSCAVTAGFNCTRDLSAQLSYLPARYNALAKAITANLKVSHTYIADYPARIFTNENDAYETCGVFDLMSNGDAQWIANQGTALDSKIAAAAATNHWEVIHTTDAFRHHGYCADGAADWFRSWSGSQAVQGDHDGTAHPLYAGHAKVAELVAARVKANL
jgi:hypothetical protein